MDFIHTAVSAVTTYIVLASVLGLGAKLYLSMRFRSLESPEGYSTPDVLFAIVAPTLIALAWVISGGTHMFRTFGRGLLAQTSTVEHFFVVGGLSYLGYRTVRKLLETQTGFADRADLPTESLASKRLRAVCRSHPVLEEFTHRIRAVNAIDAPCVTRGIFKAETLVHCEFIDQLSQGELQAALLHEVAHARARDPLHKCLGTIATMLNPVGFLLKPELTRWLWACELTCDWRALSYGADRTELAGAVVSAARGTQRCRHDHGVHIHGEDNRRIELRIQLLLGDAEGRDSEPREQTWPYYLGISAGFMLLAGYLPHLTDAALLPMHCLVEIGHWLV